MRCNAPMGRRWGNSPILLSGFKNAAFCSFVMALVKGSETPYNALAVGACVVCRCRGITP